MNIPFNNYTNIYEYITSSNMSSSIFNCLISIYIRKLTKTKSI